MRPSRIHRYVRHGTLPQLAVFEASARLRSFTRAAEELHLAQPTVSAQIRKSSGWQTRFTGAWISGGCSTAIRGCYHTVGSLSPDFCARVGTRTVKKRFFICWQSDRQLIRFHRLHGMHCGAIVIVTKVTVISLRSACHCSCTSTRMHGSTFETAARRRATASTISKTPSLQRSRIAPFA